jgi:hypothetical protein
LLSPAINSDNRTLGPREENIPAIMWKNGFFHILEWVNLKILNANGTPAQQRGVATCPGTLPISPGTLIRWPFDKQGFWPRSEATIAAEVR